MDMLRIYLFSYLLRKSLADFYYNHHLRGATLLLLLGYLLLLSTAFEAFFPFAKSSPMGVLKKALFAPLLSLFAPFVTGCLDFVHTLVCLIIVHDGQFQKI